MTDLVLLKFFPEDPALWFAQIQGQFTLNKITSDAMKFQLVITQLSTQYAAKVADIIKNPPAMQKYEKLKTELIKRLSVSTSEQQLNHVVMGNEKPSEFLRRLRDACSGLSDEDLRTIWSNRLPVNIQSVVKPLSNNSLEEIAALADRVYDIVRQ